jgi:predicted metal-binding protein
LVTGDFVIDGKGVKWKSMVRKIMVKVPNALLIPDLNKYKEEAIKLGASDARVKKSYEVIIDERAYLKCVYPKFYYYGTNANCPPYSIKPDLMKKIIKSYKYGIIFTLEVPSEAFVGSYDVLIKKGKMTASRKKMYEINSKLETMAFYDGYYFALGFAGGPCKSFFCNNLECQALTSGKPCRFPLKSRASMEGVGIDVFGMAARMGWDIYPCGQSLSPEDVPFGRRMGLVLIY